MTDWTNVEQAAKKCANNHATFESFAWWGSPDDSEKWTIYTPSHRDSGLLEESNAEAIRKELSQFEGDFEQQSHNHWAVGHVNSMIIRVYAKRGKDKITPVFRKFCELQDFMQGYPILDETDYSRRQYEAAVENISSEGGIDSVLAAEVYSWLFDNDQEQLEDSDDRGSYPSKEAIQAALEAIEEEEEHPNDAEESLSSVRAQGTPLLDIIDKEV